jgi:branched-chain amino acid transport system ATP-binding protein
MKVFGGLAAVSELDMDVYRGEILGLIGPNGAGKSTVLNMIGGSLNPKRGLILFEGRNIAWWPAYVRARRGITRVFQRNALFHSMTVIENVLAGSHLHGKHGILETFYRTQSIKRYEKFLLDRAEYILGFVGLKHQAKLAASALPHGSQRLLCLAVALAADPELLLLDEPFTGMNMKEINKMIALIKKSRDARGITVIVVEHNMKAVLDLCDRAVVLNYGRKMIEGKPGDVIADQSVIEAYLGADDVV